MGENNESRYYLVLNKRNKSTNAIESETRFCFVLKTIVNFTSFISLIFCLLIKYFLCFSRKFKWKLIDQLLN